MRLHSVAYSVSSLVGARVWSCANAQVRVRVRVCRGREGKAQGMQGDAGRSQGQKHTKDATCFQQSLNCTTRITA